MLTQRLETERFAEETKAMPVRTRYKDVDYLGWNDGSPLECSIMKLADETAKSIFNEARDCPNSEA